MSHSRVNARAVGAAFLLLTILLAPAVGRSRPSRPASRTGGTDGQWTQNPPPILEEPMAVYDPVREAMIFFGGRQENGGPLTNQVWQLSLNGAEGWSLLKTTGTPPAPRAGHALLYDSRRERLLVFGGADSVMHNDFWVLDLAVDPPAWQETLAAFPIHTRVSYGQAIYDSLDDRVIVFGGADSLDQNNTPILFENDVWALPLTGPAQWIDLTPSGTPPSPRVGAAMDYDPARHRVVLFGGYDGDPLGDAFTLSLDSNPAWAPLAATGGPPAARAFATLDHDGPRDRILLFGGHASSDFSDVWQLDLASNVWSEVPTVGSPPGSRQEATGIHDPIHDEFLVFGGRSDTTDHLSHPLYGLSLDDSHAWSDRGSHTPSTRWNAACAVDPTRRVMWMHGGTRNAGGGGSGLRPDLWALPLNGLVGWDEPPTTGDPLRRRFGHSAIYDAANDRLIFFGGQDENQAIRNDVWELALGGTPAWSELSPGGTPPEGRKFHTAVYDPDNQRMVVFGGSNASGEKHDVWALSLDGAPVWTEILPAGPPPPNLLGQSGAVEDFGKRLIVYGGSAGAMSDSVYALTLTGDPVWERILPSGAPPPSRRFAAMVGLGTHMVVSGGAGGPGGSVPLNDAWMLELEPPSWRKLNVGSELPTGRSGHAAVFDFDSHTMTVFSGESERPQPDTWSLVIDYLVPAMASLVSANARPGRVELAWEVSSRLESASVQRSTDGTTWEELGSVLADGSGRLTYVDLDVVSGSRYGYRLALTGDAMSAPVWVEVPEAARFALRGMSPNPGPAAAALVAFTLPDGAPARLEVMDIAGRQVFAREVGSLGPGQHFVRVSGESAMAPGVYLVRLTRDGQSLTAKAVATR